MWAGLKLASRLHRCSGRAPCGTLCWCGMCDVCLCPYLISDTVSRDQVDESDLEYLDFVPEGRRLAAELRVSAFAMVQLSAGEAERGEDAGEAAPGGTAVGEHGATGSAAADDANTSRRYAAGQRHAACTTAWPPRMPTFLRRPRARTWWWRSPTCGCPTVSLLA